MAGKEEFVKARVGFFVLVGLLIAGGLAIYFGRLGDGLRQYYQVVVEYPNASGLIRGADVLMAGAKIGFVSNPPRILENLRGVSVDLQIYENVEIPSKSSFVIGSSGLLGDRFVDVILEEDSVDSPPIEPGTVVKGSRQTGMDDLAAEGTLLLTDMRETVANINGVVTRIGDDFLKEQTLKEIEETVSNLRATSEAFASASEGIDEVVADAKKAAASAAAAAEKASDLVESGGDTLDRVETAAAELERTIKEARGLIHQARYGSGTIAMLLNDQTFAQNLRDLISNLRQRGILWYRDVEGAER